MLLALLLYVVSASIADASAPIGDPIAYNAANNIFGRHLDDISNNSAIQLYDIYKGIYGQVKPNRTMRILELVDVLMPAFADTLKDSDYNFIEDEQNNPFNFKMSNFTIDIDSLELAVGTAPVSDVQLVPGYLSVSDVTTEVRIYVERDEVTGANRFGLNGFGLAATWWIGGTGLDFKLTKVGGTFYFYGAPRTGTVPIGSFFSTLGEAILPDGPVKSTLEKSGLDEFSLENTRFRARYSKLEGFALALSGRPTIADWSAFDMTVLFHRYRSVPWREGLAMNVVTMATILDSFRLSTVVKTLVGLDVSEIPVLGSLVVPRLGVVVSTDDVAPNLLPEVVDDPLLWDAQPFSKGVTLVTRFALKSDLDPIRFLIRVGPNDLSFNIVDYAATLTVRNLVEAMLPDFDLDSLLLPPGVSNVFDLAINEFGYDHRLKVLTTRLTLDKSVVVVPNLVTIDKPYLRINVTLSKPRRKAVESGGQWLLGSSKVPVSVDPVDPIAPLPSNGEADGPPRPVKGFMIKAEDSAWNVGEVMRQFGASFLPDEFDSILASFADFRILEPKAQIPVGLLGGQFLMFLAGRPEIAGWNDMTLNALIAKKGGKTSMAVGFEFANVDFSWLVKKLTGFDVDFLKMLARSLRCGFVLAKESAPDVALIGDLLQNVPIQRGISIVALFSFPGDCDGDAFCEYAKRALGANAHLRLSATVTSLREFRLYAVAGNINLGPKLTLTDAGLEFVVGPEPTFGITATLKLVDPPLSFRGAIRVGPVQGLELAMTMIGIWKRPFSISFLAFGNAHLSVALRPGVGVTALQIGGELHIGNIGNGKEIIAVVHVGVDAVSPRRNYFCGKINKATIPALMNAFDFDVKIPKVLSQIGFPDGLETSFAFDTIELPTGLVIPAGFKLNGTLVILGYKLKCDIALTPPSAMRVRVEMDPLNLARGQIRLQRSRSDSKRGPILDASVTLLPAPKVLVRAAGYVKLFGLLNRGASLEIDDKSFTIEVVGRLFLFYFKVRVSASYGSLKSAAFRVYAEMSSGGMSTIAKRVRDIIDKGAKDATKKIGDAQAKVESANKAYDDAIRSMEKSRKDVDGLQVKYDEAIRGMERKKGDVDGIQKKYDAAIRDLESKKRALKGAQKKYADAIKSLESKKKDVNSLQKKYDAAIRNLEGKKRSVDSAQKKYDAAIRVLESKKKSVDSAQRKYDDAVNNLRRKQKDVDKLCSIKRCGTTKSMHRNPFDSIHCFFLVPYPCGVKMCGGWVRYPCGVKMCSKKVTDPVCITFNAGCKGLRATAYAALELAKQVVDKNRWPLNVAKGALTAAQKIVDKNRWPLDVAKGALTAAQKIVDNNRWPLDVAKRALSVAQKIVNNNRWPLDVAKGALTLAQKVVNKNRWPLDVAKGALTVAQQVVDKNRWPLDAAKGALKTAQVVVDKNRWPLDAAKGVLEGVKYTVKAGAAAAKFIVSAGLGGLIDIKKLTFDVKIGLVSSGHVAGSATVSFLKKRPKKFSFNIRMNSIESMAKDFAEMAFKGITGRRRRRDTSGFSERHYFPERFVHRPGLFERYPDRMIVDDELPVLPSISRGSDEDYVDLKSRLIDERPGESWLSNIYTIMHFFADTVEAKCEHYRSLVGVLRVLLETFGAVSSGVQQTVKDYLTTKVDLAEAIVEDDNGTNGTLVDVDDICTKAATSFLSRNEGTQTIL